MVVTNSLDDTYKSIIVGLLHDANASFGEVFNKRAMRLTIDKIEKRLGKEGLGFLTKTLPRLGKHLDQALALKHKFDANSIGFKPLPGSKLPRFLGELFGLVFNSDGVILHNPDANSVGFLREVCGLFYKLRLPYEEVQEHKVISAFENAEADLTRLNSWFSFIAANIDDYCLRTRRGELGTEFVKSLLKDYSLSEYPEWLKNESEPHHAAAECFRTVREGRITLSEIFSSFNISNVVPKHGPGVVATKQQGSGKFKWTNISASITSIFPMDAYFYASAGHVCDSYDGYNAITEHSLPARVLLVPKDSRGPRLISCEPVDFQWIQQGVKSELTRILETHPLTRGAVSFIDQQINRDRALSASISGSHATLDLKEASDRVHVDLVRLLFPEHLTSVLLACRSTSTQLPDGRILNLTKYAPMGSALCFPVLASVVWLLTRLAITDRDARKDISVYGDDVIIPTAYADAVITQLERFGLMVNRDKSCIHGLFKESCGMDAFAGSTVTPVRIRAGWTTSPSPGSYCSYISYANAFYDKKRYFTYNVIYDMLYHLYGSIPGPESNDSCPCLRSTYHGRQTIRTRFNRALQKVERYVRCVVPVDYREDSDGWIRLLRYFTEGRADRLRASFRNQSIDPELVQVPFDSGRYTQRRMTKVVRRWR